LQVIIFEVSLFDILHLTVILFVCIYILVMTNINQ
jgi:hypothetical protein